MKKKGFTLIETIIYTAIFSVIIGAVVGAVYQIIQSSDKLNDKFTVEGEAQFIMRKIEWALTGASAINSPASGSTGGTLSVNKTNFANNPIVFDLDAGNARVAKGAGSPTALNSVNVTVSNLQFQHIASGAYTPAAIKASFNVNGNPYGTTIYLRK
ncbi:MAG: prepilin-type N-terminal cleavage/methylation domain-containing protein [Candidatus Colwellbacteria bacterium]|nr:prepilin-type N-terminal cleavage/methylation domain-containing protein [Candidatus Colwellbacteria bacterium]